MRRLSQDYVWTLLGIPSWWPQTGHVMKSTSSIVQMIAGQIIASRSFCRLAKCCSIFLTSKEIFPLVASIIGFVIRAALRSHSSHSSTGQALTNQLQELWEQWVKLWLTIKWHLSFSWEHVFPKILTGFTTYFQHNCNPPTESDSCSKKQGPMLMAFH